MRRCCVVLLGLALLPGCNDIYHYPASPTSPPPVAPTRLVLSVSPLQLPAGGGTATIRVETTAGGGSVPAPGVAVRLSADAGSLGQPDVVTDATGHATVSWNGTRSATVSGTSGALTATASVVVGS